MQKYFHLQNHLQTQKHKIMKRLVFSLLSVMLFAFAQAQVSNSVDGANAGNATVAKGDWGVDHFVGWSDETEVFSYRMGGQGSLGYLTSGMDFGFGDVSLVNGYLGYGIKKRFYMNDVFLIQAAVWPYAGFSMITVDDESESEYDFLYGISAQIEAGIKIFTTKKGNDLYLTIGYNITAPEFETENVVENGTWQIGVTRRF